MTFTDDCTRKTWLYILKEKSNVFDAFKSFKTLVEEEPGYEIKCLRNIEKENILHLHSKNYAVLME